jgi:Domain of unknown function (DUF4271)
MLKNFQQSFLLIFLFSIFTKSSFSQSEKNDTGLFFHQSKQNFFGTNTDTFNQSFLFSFGKSDSGYHQQMQYYQYFDSLHLMLIDFEKSNFLQTKNTERECYNAHLDNHSSYIFYLFIFLFLMIVLVKSFFNNYFSEIFKTVFKFNSTQSTFQLESFFSLPGILLAINFFVSLSLICFLFSENIQNNNILEKWKILLIILGLAVGYVFFRIIINFFSKIIFEKKNFLESLIGYDTALLSFAGILFTPMAFLITFSSPSILKTEWIVFFILVLALLLVRFYFFMQISLKQMFDNLFHFVLYICSVELAPVLIFLKFIQHWFVINLF